VEKAIDSSQWDDVSILQTDALSSGSGVSFTEGDGIPRYVARRNRLLTGVLLHQQRHATRVLPEMCSSDTTDGQPLQERFNGLSTTCTSFAILDANMEVRADTLKVMILYPHVFSEP
jgi:hypothetical protein